MVIVIAILSLTFVSLAMLAGAARLILAMDRFSSPKHALLRWRVELAYNGFAALYFAHSALHGALGVLGVLPSSTGLVLDLILTAAGAGLAYLYVNDIRAMFDYVGMSAQKPTPPPLPPACEAVPAGHDGPDSTLGACAPLHGAESVEFKGGVLSGVVTTFPDSEPPPADTGGFNVGPNVLYRSATVIMDVPDITVGDTPARGNPCCSSERPPQCRPGMPPMTPERNDRHEAA